MLLSGSTFVVALLGMFLVPVTLLRSLAAGAVIVGVVSVAAALTLLPSILSLLGQRSWYLPRWLDWLPHLQADPTPGTLLRYARNRRPTPMTEGATSHGRSRVHACGGG